MPCKISLSVVYTMRQRRLLAEDTLTLKPAFKIATGMEAASKDAKTLQKSKVKSGSSATNVESRPPPCKHCGRNNHAVWDCQFQAGSVLLLWEVRTHRISMPFTEEAKEQRVKKKVPIPHSQD